MPVNPSFIDPIPLPEKPQPDVTETRQMQQPPQGLPTEAGYVSKAGAGAYIGTQILQGWLAGTKVKRDRQHQAAVDDVKQAKTAYDVIAGKWQDYISSGGDKNGEEGKKLQEALVSTWDDYTHTAVKYAKGGDPTAQGQEGQKKQGAMGKVGGALKKGLGVGQPEVLFDHISQQMMQMKGGPAMFDTQSSQDKAANAEASMAQLQEKTMKETQESKKKYKDILAKGNGATPEEQKWLETYEKADLGVTPEQKLRGQITEKIMNGQKLDGPMKDYAVAQGFIKEKEPTLMQDGNTGVNYSVVLNPDGTSTSHVINGPNGKPIRGHIPETASQAYTSEMNARFAMTKRMMGKKPDGSAYTDQEIWQAVGSQMGIKNPDLQQYGDDRFAVSNAIKQVYAEDKPNREADSNFFAVSPDGMYFYRSTMGPETEVKHWFSPNEKQFAGGMQEKDAAGREAQFRGRMLTKLALQFRSHDKKMTEEQAQAKAQEVLDRVAPPVYQAAGVQSVPQPGRGSKGTFTIKDPQGNVVAQDATAEEKAAYESDKANKGSQITPN
jgi:hypothetical protein